MDVGAEKRKIYKNLWFPVDFPLNKSVDNRFSDFLCLKHLAWTPVLRKQEVAPVVEGPKIVEQPAVVKPKKEKSLDGKEPGGSINEDTPNSWMVYDGNPTKMDDKSEYLHFRKLRNLVLSDFYQ